MYSQQNRRVAVLPLLAVLLAFPEIRVPHPVSPQGDQAEFNQSQANLKPLYSQVWVLATARGPRPVPPAAAAGGHEDGGQRL